MTTERNEAELTRLYIEWGLRFQSFSGNHYLSIFSPEWTQWWEELSADYEALEKRRAGLDLGLDELHTDFERYKSQASALSFGISELESTESHEQCPLRVAVERFQGRKQLVDHSRPTWLYALRSWEWCRRYLSSKRTADAFWGSLSNQQQVSLRLLEDWWDAKYQDKRLSTAARRSILDAADASNEISVAAVKQGSRIEDSLYHSWGLMLFMREFSILFWEPFLVNNHLRGLVSWRTGFLAQAYAQRIAYTAYRKRQGSPDQLRVSEASYIRNVNVPCYWRPSTDRSIGMPYYLWDAGTNRTVVVSELDHVPEYLCVSHTWGRWRKLNIAVDGVPWLVPQNERFNVQDLPKHLRSIQPPCRFIWIDLFCIPQDGSPKADEEIARQAIIFQRASRCIAWLNDVSGWTGMSAALEWLGLYYLSKTSRSHTYDVIDMLNASEFLEEHSVEMVHSITLKRGSVRALQLRKDKDRKLHRDFWPIATKEALEEYADDRINASSVLYYNPSSWFSSLWTLQEAALCPSLMIVGREWDTLTDAAGVAIPLDALFIFIRTVHLFCDYTESEVSFDHPLTFESRVTVTPKALYRRPLAAKQLHWLCDVTRLGNVLQVPSTTGVLVTANLRQCSDNRAPAIMSALGVTDWFAQPGGQAGELVLGTYPLGFVREASRRLGASFFEHYSENTQGKERIGSMMPFGKLNGWFTDVTAPPGYPRLKPEDHLSVRAWVIATDGSVRIRSAGILAAKGRRPHRSIRATISTKDVFRGHDLNTWLENHDKSPGMYAVMLYRDRDQQHGIILREKRFQFQSTRKLVKIGLYFAVNQAAPQPEIVDWIVQ